MKKILEPLHGLMRRIRPRPAAAPALPADLARIAERVRPYTMTSVERVVALIDAVRYTVRRRTPGAFVECGVWRGGSVMAMILALQELGAEPRDIYLYDTFEGMTKPTEVDTELGGNSALVEWTQAKGDAQRPWNQMFGEHVFNLESVKATLAQTGYPMQHLHFVQGPVEQTLPATIAER